MSFSDDLTTSQDDTFRGRVLMAAVKAAIAIAAEEPADDAVAARRHSLAFTVLNAPESVQARFVWAVLTNPTVATAGLAATDGDLEFVVSSIWNALAGTNLVAFTAV